MRKEDRPDHKTAFLTQITYLNAVVQGIVTGIIGGLGVFLATNWLVLKQGEQVGPHLALLGQFFPGYRVSFLGSWIGLFYGGMVGFLLGFSVSTLYNRLVASKKKRQGGGGSANVG